MSLTDAEIDALLVEHPFFEDEELAIANEPVRRGRVEWCQCEQVDHENNPVMCTCPHIRFAAARCPVHNGVHHPSGAHDRSVAPRSTAFGTFYLCRHCRAAGHMGVKA